LVAQRKLTAAGLISSLGLDGYHYKLGLGVKPHDEWPAVPGHHP